ncbi:MAG: AAA family ATPase [Chlamydiales bacterium]|nr:AAA family ATPase [Chlamydiales bacterium]
MGLKELKETLVGNDKLVELLETLASSKSLASCYLLYGPKGIGKKEFAYYFASQIIYQDSKSVSTYKKLTGHLHPDISVYSPKGKLALHPADEMRKLKEEAFLNPFEASKRVFIIEDADRMLPASSNALLKTFEEPAKDSIFILTTSYKSKLLDTVLSRCQKIAFNKIERDKLYELAIEQGGDSAAATVMADLANGSVEKLNKLSKGSPLLDFRQNFFELLLQGKEVLYRDIFKVKESFEACFQQEEELFEDEKSRWEQGAEVSAFQKEHWDKKEQAVGFMQNFEVFQDILFCYLSFYRDAQVLKHTKDPSLCINHDFSKRILDEVNKEHIEEKFQQASERASKVLLAFQRSIKPFSCLEYLLLSS